MDPIEKMRLMVNSCRMDVEGEPHGGLSSSSRVMNPVPSRGVDVFYAQMGGGKTIPLLKTMLTSFCENDCNYCVFRKDRDYQRYSFSPEEMAKLFMQMVYKGVVKGMFLSSGIAASGRRSQDRLIDTVEIIRKKYQFQGYVHLKIMPGVEDAQIERAMHLADRVSINLEAPNNARLQMLAPSKDFSGDLMKIIESIHTYQQNWVGGKTPSLITQLVTGAVGDTDVEMIQTCEHLYRRYSLARVYFSPFEPGRYTPLESIPPVNRKRIVRLYQASFLLRDYGYSLEEMPFEKSGYLPLAIDPKLQIAKSQYSEVPLEINKADITELVRIPGIGQARARRIITARRYSAIRDLSRLEKMGIPILKAAPFILLNGHRPSFQPGLF